MSKGFRIALSIVILWVAVLLVLYVLRSHGVRSPYVLKMLPCSAYVLTAVLAKAYRTAYGRVLLAGLCAAWWGDFFLIGNGWQGFHRGLWAFLAGHVLYGCAFLVRGVDFNRSLTVFAPLAVFGVVFYGWLRPEIPYPLLSASVACYMLVIITMLSLATGALDKPGGYLIYVGALCFFLSDIGVAYMHFKPQSGWAAKEAALLYISGQIFLASSAGRVYLKRAQALSTDTQ